LNAHCEGNCAVGKYFASFCQEIAEFGKRRLRGDGLVKCEAECGEEADDGV
jgi:hypothetical protein